MKQIKKNSFFVKKASRKRLEKEDTCEDAKELQKLFPQEKSATDLRNYLKRR